MKNLLICLLFGISLVSCDIGHKLLNNKPEVESKLPDVQSYLAKDVDLDTTSPMPGILSEEEVLLKAADLVIEIGGLDPSFFVYEENPAMWTAKIETPVLLFDPNGMPISYQFSAIDDSGTLLMEATVSPYKDTQLKDFFGSRMGPNKNTTDEQSTHFITKREAKQLIKSTFPGKNSSDPVALTQLSLEGNRYSHYERFWYFTIPTDNSNYDEYVLAAYIGGWKIIPGGISNRNAINANGSPYLSHGRLAKLTTPLRLKDKIANASLKVHRSIDSYNSVPFVGTIDFLIVPLE